jgi:hypothetical protein
MTLSSPDGLPQDPTLSELEMDFKEVCNIRGEFVKLISNYQT